MNLSDLINNYTTNFEKLSKIYDRQTFESFVLSIFHERIATVKDDIDFLPQELEALLKNLTEVDSAQLCAHYIIYLKIRSTIDANFNENYLNFFFGKADSLYQAAIANFNPFIYKIHAFQLIKEINKLIKMKRHQLAPDRALQMSDRKVVDHLCVTNNNLEKTMPNDFKKSTFVCFLKAYIQNGLLAYKTYAEDGSAYANEILAKDCLLAIEQTKHGFQDEKSQRITSFFAQTSIAKLSEYQDLFSITPAAMDRLMSYRQK